ncbi:MAG TPA: class I SAM-dependent methyltransferase [Thermoanaerobaculia bacterium]|nr:class I SAM-dependent methyltransferase [Thermoanaerobaculia bacterium]
MATGFIRGFRVLHRAFSRYPASHRLHILIRYISCPFTRTLADIPANARLLDVGAGHSLLGILIEDRVREVVSVEPDLRKSLLPSPSPKIRKVAGYDDCIRANDFDAATIYDVLYRLPVNAHRALLERLFARLRPGGVLLVKEMDRERRWKMRWTRWQEWLVDRVDLTLGEAFVFQTTAELESMLRDIGFTDFRARAIDRGYPHPHIVYTARKPAMRDER